MDATLVRQAFMKLKPLCDSFVKDPQKKMLQTIAKQCQILIPEVLQDVHTYVLFPFLVHLKNPDLRSRHDLLFSLVEGMHDILAKTHLENFELYHKYFSTLIYQIFDKDSPGTVAIVDEDFALLVVKTITVLTLRLPNDMRSKLYTRENAPTIGQGIYLCVQVAKREKYIALRLEALNCIMALCTVHEQLQNELHTPRLNQKLGKCVGDVLMFFLPGLMGGLQEIAKGDPKQGVSITCLSIKGISRILCLVMMDSNSDAPLNKAEITEKDFMQLVSSHRANAAKQPKMEPDPFGKKLRAKGHEGMMEHLEKAQRNTEWYKAAGDKLILLIKSLVSVQSHHHEKVRLELALLCYDLVFYCPRNMHQSLKYILEMTITLSEDSDPKVSTTSRTAMEYFSHRSFNQNKKQLYDVLEDNFMSVLTKMPSALNNLDHMKRLSGLNLFKGYLRLLTVLSVSPQGLTKALCCSHIMTRFTVVLIDIFKMESTSIKLLDEFAVRDVETLPSESCPWKIFTHLDNDRCFMSAKHACEIIGASEATEMIVDYLLEQFREGSDSKKEIIMILNEIVSAPSPLSKEHLIKDIITTYTEIENWYLPTIVNKNEKEPGLEETFDVTIYNPKEWIKERTYGLYEGATDTRYTDMSYSFRDVEDNDGNDDDFETCRSIREAQNNIIKICLMTEGIGKMAKSLGTNFETFLLKTLYLILERAGSGNELIHQAGMKALSDITAACRMTDITQLIKENADYFTHHVNLKLRKISDNAGVLDVLLVVMKYSESDVLPCLYDIVSNILMQCRSLEEQNNLTLYLRLFFTFIKYIGAKFPSEELLPKEMQKNPGYSPRPIISELMEYQETVKISSNFDDEFHESGMSAEEMYKEDLEKKAMDTDDPNPIGQQGKQIPNHIEMVVSVLKKTLNFIPSKDREQKLLALDIIKEGVLVIKDYEDQLLPLVHLVWSPLVNRFKETSQPLIIHRSFRLLVILAQVSKDFIRHRTTKEVLSKICEYLVKSSQDSYMKDVGSSYRFTQAYKLQLMLLQELGSLCISLNLQERKVYELMCAAQVYLKCKQPKPLQDACMSFFKSMMVHNSAACWLHLKGLWNSGEEEKAPELPDHMTPLLGFSCNLQEPQNKLDYQLCVTTLMDCFESAP